MFISAGGVFLDENPVTQVIPGQVITIRTAKGTFRTKKLVITAGAWAPSLLKTLGVELPLQVGGARFHLLRSCGHTNHYLFPLLLIFCF